MEICKKLKNYIIIVGLNQMSKLVVSRLQTKAASE